MIHVIQFLLLLFLKIPDAFPEVGDIPLKIYKIYWDIDEPEVSWSFSGMFGASRDITFP